jgi:cytochrome c553
MTPADQAGSSDPRFAVWIGATVVLFLAAVLVGFFWLPSLQNGSGRVDIWGSFCRAVGLSKERGGISVSVGGQSASNVTWTVATRLQLTQGNAARGGAQATTCNHCHGANGISADAAFPNLAGQSVAAIFKQLEDFKSGKRNPEFMGPYVSQLSEQDMLDLATHFSSLPNSDAATTSAHEVADSPARRLIFAGSPLRNLAPCASCHGPLGVTFGAPALQGQQRAYFEQQLQALAAGSRRNDISEQMRSVARQLTGSEIAALAAYYSHGRDQAGP